MLSCNRLHHSSPSATLHCGVREKLLRGEWPANRPVGYIYDHEKRNIVPDPKQAKIVQTVFEEFSAGNRSLLWVADRLAEFGILSQNGKPWSKALAHNFLTNRLYMGVMVWNGESFEGKFKPLITHELFTESRRGFSKSEQTEKEHEKAITLLF